MRIDTCRASRDKSEGANDAIMTDKNRRAYLERPIFEAHSLCRVESPSVWKGDVASSSTINLAGGLVITWDRRREHPVTTFFDDMLTLQLHPHARPRHALCASASVGERPWVDCVDKLVEFILIASGEGV